MGHSFTDKFNPYRIMEVFEELRKQSEEQIKHINNNLDQILQELKHIMTSLDNLTAQVQKNSDDIDAALAAIASSGATPAQLDALTTALAAKDQLIETALNMPAPVTPVKLP